MEQSMSRRSNTESYLPSFFNDDEIFVSSILLDFSNLILQQEFLDEEEEEEREKKKKSKVKASEALSPDTPFSFSPSESDENSKHSCKQISRKTTKEENLKMIDELNQREEMLEGDEIEAVKSYYNKLKSINLDLKAKRMRGNFDGPGQNSIAKSKGCRFGHQMRSKWLEMSKNLNYGVDLSKSIIRVENQDDHLQVHCVTHHQPSIPNQMVHHGSQTHNNNFQQHPYGKISPYLSSGSGSSKVMQMGPFCFSDLKVSSERTLVAVDSSQPLDSMSALIVPAAAVDDKKAKAAEARRRRMIKMKEMKKNSFAKIKPLKCK